MAEDERIAYGAQCSWWDSIDKVGVKRGLGIPCCPECGGVLFEMENEAQWFEGVDIHDAKEPGYRAFVEWQRGKCFPSYAAARVAYSVEKRLDS